MKIRIFILVTFILYIDIFAQIPNPLRFQHQNYDSSYTRSSVLGLPNGNLLYFWVEGEGLFQSRSTDGGLNWEEPYLIAQTSIYYSTDNIASSLLDSGKISIVYRSSLPNNFYSIIFSYDNGLTWSSPIILPTGQNNIQRRQTTSINVNSSPDNGVYACYSKGFFNSGIYFIKSTNNGFTWSSEEVISNNNISKNGFIFPLMDQSLLLVYEAIENENSNIQATKSTDNGLTWSGSIHIAITDLNEKRPRILMDDSTILLLFYELEKATPFDSFYQSDIVFIKSTDNGNNWSSPESFTNYKGIDFNCEVTLLNNKPFISFSSGRDFLKGRNKFQLYYGIAGETVDENTPPWLYHYEHIPEVAEPFEIISYRCYLDDDNGITNAKIVTSLNGYKADTLEMFDDGLHGDSLVSDGIFGITLNDLTTGDSRTYSFIISDFDGHIVDFNGGLVFVPLPFSNHTYFFDVNRFKLPINNQGIIAYVDDSTSFIAGGSYDESTVLYSGGFFLSGYRNNNLWANGISPSGRILDYQPGKIGVDPNDPKNNIYIVKSIDPYFGQSWQDWKYAVIMGADFYDGNSDGEYNPIDLNGNGTWDLTEDRPDFLGNVTAWCVYNDGVPSELRRFSNVLPQGIEIQQTAFALGYNLSGNIQSIIFFRYRIINRGTVVSELDSLIFGVMTDPDIGDVQEAYLDDLVGYDSLLNSAYAYNDGSDPAYGDNPPTLFTGLLQGPLAYIPGETFIDINSNGIYDEGIDTPLDSAYHFNGLFMGSRIFPGAKNLPSTSFVNIMQSHPELGDPNTSTELRNFQLGLTKLGNVLDPCTWTFGNVYGVNCNEVNPLFWYSGDPLINLGWINTFPTDQRMMLNSGQFKLNENEPVDIWVAYLVGRGTDAFNSVTVGREVNQYAIDYYKSNFTILPVGVDQENPVLNSFVLYQNYPNPFNPVTTIKYHLPELSIVSLKVFDILGQEIKTLVNTEQNAGSYEINFNASSLSSGIYFYELRTQNFSSVKKMILLR